MDDAPNPSPALITAHITPARGFGGVAEFTGGIARAWVRQGRTFRVAVSDGSRGPALTVAAIGLGERAAVHLYRARWLVRWGFGLGAPRAIYAACREASAVYIGGIATWPTTLAYLICRWMGRPYVAAPHGGMMPAYVALLRRRRRLKWCFYRLFVLPALRRAAAIHVTSPLEADGVRAVIPDAPIVEIPNGVDIAFWQSTPTRRRDAGVLHLCYVGRLSPEKGIHRFIGAWDRARAPGDRLTIVGEGVGPYADAVQALARRIGAPIAMTGSLDREGVRAALAVCDALVLPSGMEDGDVRENFGIAAAEALAAGRPLLVTRGLAWDMVEAGGFGVLFSPEGDDLPDALRRLAALDPDAASRAATGWAAANVDLDHTATRLWRLVIGAAGPPP